MNSWITVKETARMGDPVHNAETGAIEWQVTSRTAEALTGREIQAIRQNTPVKNINMACATDVKRWIGEGLTISEMVFKGKGRKGYGARMIKYYSAALRAPLSKHKPLSR